MSDTEDRIKDYAKCLVSEMMSDDDYQEMVDDIVKEDQFRHPDGQCEYDPFEWPDDSPEYRLFYETAASIAAKVLAYALLELRIFPDPK